MEKYIYAYIYQNIHSLVNNCVVLTPQIEFVKDLGFSQDLFCALVDKLRNTFKLSRDIKLFECATIEDLCRKINDDFCSS